SLLRNHFKMAWRQLYRHKAFSAISILGLTIGISAALIILRFTTYQLSYDQFHDNKDNIYRVVCQPCGDNQEASARNYYGLGSLIQSDFPQMEHVVRFWKMWNNNDGYAWKYNNQIFYERELIEADASFFQVFPSLLLKGDPKTVLSQPNSLVISELTAKKYFGEEDPIGKVLNSSEYDYLITGVSKDMPDNSHFKVNMVSTMYEDDWSEQEHGWYSLTLYTYLTIKDQEAIPGFEEELTKVVQAKSKEFEHLEKVEFKLQPITNIHLDSDLTHELGANSDRSTVYAIGGIGLLVLIMAWINHINLFTSRFLSRARELSIRSIMGAGKANLTGQLLVEYICLMSISGLLAVATMTFAEPYLIHYQIIPNMGMGYYRPDIWLAAASIILMGSLLTGLYPSLLLSKIKVQNGLKGRIRTGKSKHDLRGGLLVFQLAISITLIAGVTILSKQLEKLRTADLNMNVDQVVAIHNPTTYTEFEGEENKVINYQTFRNELTSHSSISSVASSSSIPGSPVGFSYIDHLKNDRTEPRDAKRFKMVFIDQDFFEVYGIGLIAGRSYSSGIQQDVNQKSIILSVSAIEHLGYSSAREAIHQTVDFKLFDEWASYEIIGVFEDYRHESTKVSMYPSIMFFNRYDEYIMHHLYHSFKINIQGDTEAALAHLEESWAKVWPEKPLEYYFLDTVYERQFKEEESLSNTFKLFSIIAVIVAGLGILGMTLFEVQLRKKEISIRKVLGSSVAAIVKLLSRRYVALLAIAGFVSAPIVYSLGGQWLNNYPDPITLSPALLALPVMLVLLVVALACGVQILKSAVANPIDNLRDE
ncbi:MAG: ABC transporter permease, partial [Cyclobacteriaceae bacterium]